MVSVTPFGQDGPYAGFQATNAVSFALGGIMSLTGDGDRPPLVTGGSQAQYLGGLNAFGAASTAWLGRLVQGEGDWIDISCQEAAASMVELYVPGTAYGEAVQLRMGNQVRAVWGLYPCVDGYAGAFCLERQIRGLFSALDDPELVDERFTDPLRRLDPDGQRRAAGEDVRLLRRPDEGRRAGAGPPLQGPVRGRHDPRRPAGLARAGRTRVLG